MFFEELRSLCQGSVDHTEPVNNCFFFYLSQVRGVKQKSPGLMTSTVNCGKHDKQWNHDPLQFFMIAPIVHI